MVKRNETRKLRSFFIFTGAREYKVTNILSEVSSKCIFHCRRHLLPLHWLSVSLNLRAVATVSSMKTCTLFIVLFSSVLFWEVSAQTKKTAVKKPVKKTVKKPAAPESAVVSAPQEEILLGKINTGKMTIKVHRMMEIFLAPCDKCVGTEQSFKPKPNHRVLLFEISRRNANNYELNAQLENTTPLYARILGTDNKEYACYSVPSLIEIAMAQKKGINEQNAKMYYLLQGSAPARTEHRAYALAIEMPLDVQPKELIWKKEMQLTCPLNMQNNKLLAPVSVAADNSSSPKTTFSMAQ